MTKTEDFLAHYGVKGMKWGVQKSSSESPPASADAARAEAAITSIRAGGTRTLSNDELKALVARRNLEEQYARLAPETARSKAAGFIKNLVWAVNTTSQVTSNASKIRKDVAKLQKAAK